MAVTLTAATGRRNYGSTIPFGTVKAKKNFQFWKGQIVGTLAAGSGGYAIPAGGTGWDQTCTPLGIAAYDLDTTADATDGLHDLFYEPGTFGDFASGTSADLIVEANKYADFYVQDDNTLCLTSQSSTIPKGGKILDIADDGVSLVAQFEVIR